MTRRQVRMGVPGMSAYGRREFLGGMAASLASVRAGLDSPREDPAGRAWVEEQMRRLTLPEKVGQLLCISMRSEQPESLVESGRAGAGYLLSGVLTPEDIVARTNQLQKLSKLPFFVMGGIEAGAGQIAKGATSFPSNMAIGATGSEEMAFQAGRITAVECRAMGVQWPGPTVCDVNTNPRNPIISTRSFGDSPDLVARLSVALVRGLQTNSAVGWGNHFPGHGDTGEDSHIDMPVVRHGLDRLERVDLVPFRALIKFGVHSFGTSHIWFPELEPEQLPATLSRRILTDLLRNQLGFRGVISSDSFAMQAIRKHFEIEAAIVKGFEAGNDMLLAYPDTAKCHGALVRAIERNPALAARLDESLRRMLRLKAWAGMHRERILPPGRTAEAVGIPAHRKVALEIARKAMTVIKGESFIRSLRDSEPLLIVGSSRKRRTGEVPHQELLELLRRKLPRARFLEVSNAPDEAESRAVLAKARNAGFAMAAIFTRVTAYDPAAAGVAAGQSVLLKEVIKAAPTGIVCYGAPYALSEFAGAEALVCAYDDSLPCLTASAELIAAEFRPQGRLPVALQLPPAQG